jgi:hypothetical protein
MLAVKVLSANEFLPNVSTRSLQLADALIRLQTSIHALFRQAGRYRHFRPFVHRHHGMAATKSYSAPPYGAAQHHIGDHRRQPLQNMPAASHGTMALPHALPVNSGKKPGIGAVKRGPVAATTHAAAAFGMQQGCHPRGQWGRIRRDTN